MKRQRFKRPPPAFSFDELALLLGLPADAAPGLSTGEVFTGPSGLPCRLLAEGAKGGWAGARPVVMLGLRANELAGDDVQQLLAVQGRLLQEGLWFLGSAEDGQLQVTALRGCASPRDVAAALDVAHLVALAVLRLLLKMAPPVEPVASEEQVT